MQYQSVLSFVSCCSHLRCTSRRFNCSLLLASLLQAMRLIDYTAPFISQSFAVIGALWSSHCSIVLLSCCSLSYVLLYHFSIDVITLQPSNMNRDTGIENSWSMHVHNKKHTQVNRKMLQQRTAEGKATCWNNGTMGGLKCTNHSRPSRYNWSHVIYQPHLLKKTSNQTKTWDLHLKWLLHH